MLTRENVAYGVTSCIEIESTKKIQTTWINEKKSPKYTLSPCIQLPPKYKEPKKLVNKFWTFSMNPKKQKKVPNHEQQAWIWLLFDYYLQKINSSNDYWFLNQRPNLRIKQKKKISIHFIFPSCNQVKRAKWSTSLIYLSSKQQTQNTCSTQKIAGQSPFENLPKKQVQLDHPSPPHPLETFYFHNTQP